MFHLTFNAIFVLLISYIYFRIRSLLLGNQYKRIFSWLYFPVALIVPISDYLSHTDDGSGLKGLVDIGYYLLAWFFYLFLFLVAYDVLTGVGRILKIVPCRAVRSQNFNIISLVILLSLPICVIAIGRARYATIQVTEYHIKVPRKSSSLEHLKIAVASDFHLNERTDEKFMPSFVEKVNLQKPDVVLLPGDLVEGDNRGAETLAFAKQFRQINSKYGVFASLGNHEHHGMQGALDFFEKSNIKILADAVEKIDQAFYLVGRNENHFYNRKPLDELLSSISEKLPIIVMDHRPENFESVSNYPVDIQVSGHTHNGQVYPLNYLIDHLYELSWGHKKIRNTDFFVTCGIQGWGAHVRTTGVSELMIINVDFVEQ